MPVNRSKSAGAVTEIPEALPTSDEIADLIQSYRSAGWGWETLERVSGVNHAVLRKMLANEAGINVWYSMVEKVWNFHREQLLQRDP